MGRVKILLLLIVFLAAVLRLWNLSNFPAGFTPDEASFGYDAYSILKTGKDQWEESFPLTFRSFGDFKAPLYTYLAVPFVAVFGLNEFAVRLPNAILGTLAVLVTYLLVVELFKRGITQNPSTLQTVQGRTEQSRSATSSGQARNHAIALVAALLLAVSPWHISLSRGAFEANLTTFLMPLGVYAFLRGITSPKWMTVSAIAFGLNLFSYHSAKLVTPLALLVLVGWKWNEVKKHTLAGLIFLLFFSFSVFASFSGDTSRASDIGIFNPTGGWGAVSERRFEAVQAGLPDAAARVFSNKFIYTTSEFVKNYLSYLSPTFLFTQGAGEATYGMIPGHGVLYLFELPFILMALWHLVRGSFARRPLIRLIVIWVLIAPIPAALTKGPGFAANRAAVMVPAIQILSAYGAIALWQMAKRIKNYELRIKKLGLIGYWVIGLLGVLFFLEAYFYHGPRVNAPSMSYGWREAVGEVREVGDNYGEIVVSRALSEPHIFIAFYNKWDPVDYQRESREWMRYEAQNLLFVDQLGEWHLGKYTFRDIQYHQDQALPNTLIVGRAKDFPENVVVEKKVLYPDGKPAMLLVDPQKQKYAKIN